MALTPLRAMIRKDLLLFFSDRRSVIVSFIVPGVGRSIEEVLQDWQALGQMGVFVGGSWATGFDVPDPLYQWNYAGQVGHGQSYAGW